MHRNNSIINSCNKQFLQTSTFTSSSVVGGISYSGVCVCAQWASAGTSAHCAPYIGMCMCIVRIFRCVWVCAQFAYTVMSAQYTPYIKMCGCMYALLSLPNKEFTFGNCVIFLRNSCHSRPFFTGSTSLPHCLYPSLHLKYISWPHYHDTGSSSSYNYKNYSHNKK